MKKFLLSLFAALAVSPAFAETETLTISTFGDPSSYTKKDYTSTSTKIAYHAYAMKGSNAIQMNTSKAGSCVYSSSNPDEKVIKSISITVASGTKTIDIYCDNQPFTDYSNAPNHGTKVDQISVTSEVHNITGKGYKYFLITPNSGAVYISSIVIEYEDEDDPRTFVSLSYGESLYSATLGEPFSAQLTCSVQDALSAVQYTSSDETVATISGNGEITILDDGVTTISAFIPESNEEYYSNVATFDLEVKDPNAVTATLNTDFFGNNSSYSLYTKEDEKTKIQYTSDYFYSAGDMQYNTSNSNGVGSGVAVTFTNPNYIISSIKINISTPGSGVYVYKKDSAFKQQTLTTGISTDGATKIGDAYKSTTTIAIGAPAFAIVPVSTGVIKISSIEVTYAKKSADDGSELFDTDAFKDYMICKDDMVTIELPEDAPAITFTSSNEEVATIEDGVICALKHGNTEITASWDAVPSKWMAGSDKFKVYVKYATLAEVLADAHDSTGFVKEGETYVGNFPVVVASDNGNYNYVTDGTAWALFYVNHNHGEGAILEAGWSGKYTVRNGLPEFTDIKHSDIPDEKGEFTINTYDDLVLDENVLNEVMVLNDVKFDATTKSYGETYIGNYNGQEVTFFNQFDIDQVEAGTYNVKGAISNYKGAIQVYPIEYIEQPKTNNPSHIETKLAENGVVEFTNVEEGAHIYYRHGGEDPDHTNVFTEASQQQVKRLAVDTSWTYNHTTHPLTFTGEEMSVKYIAKKAGKAPSDVQTLAIDGSGSTTSIVEINAVKGGEAIYDLMGRKVANPVRGLYIQNGAKHLVR